MSSSGMWRCVDLALTDVPPNILLNLCLFIGNYLQVLLSPAIVLVHTSHLTNVKSK
jgi:hypothetical protein